MASAAGRNVRRLENSGADAEQELARQFDAQTRTTQGRYFTPAALVSAVFLRLREHVPGSAGPPTVVDPSCGAGAFLSQAQAFFPNAPLFGLELDAAVAAHCRTRLPAAQIVRGDALRGGLEQLQAKLPANRFELWVGNPPYNGTSPLLKDPAAYSKVRALLPRDALPKGTSLRDDFAFFLLLCAQRLRERAGLLAFVTPSSLLDAFLYAPLRRHLLDSLELREVLELGAGAFEDTQVRTCVTIWSSRREAHSTYRRRRAPSFEWSEPQPLHPETPEWILRPADGAAAALDARWRAEGEPLTELIPVSFAGLKTRFDELLVDEDPQRLLRRLEAFLATPLEALGEFAQAHQIPSRCLSKLTVLREKLEGVSVNESRVRPFYRYAGARHRGAIPESARAFCYLDRRFIPRGDHRLQGEWDPHAGPIKLVFNVRELPLCSALLTREGCVHDHRHARFAPLEVPETVWREGPGAARRTAELGAPVLNLSPRGRALAQRLGGAERAFEAICAFINSEPVQRIWAPAYGASRELPVPVDQM